MLSTESTDATGISTTDDTAVELLANPTPQLIREINVVNEGAAPGWVAWDGGTVWFRIPAGPSSRTFDLRFGLISPASIKIKRDAGGTNMSGVHADAY